MKVKKQLDQVEMPGIKLAHGGRRSGSGRPAGTSRKSPTVVMRVPAHMVDQIKAFIEIQDMLHGS